jgi:hypothetical protein
MAQPTFPHPPVSDMAAPTPGQAGRRSPLRRVLAIGALLVLILVAAVSLYRRPPAPPGTKVDSSGQRGSGPR